MASVYASSTLGFASAGGIVGSNRHAKIIDCYNTGIVSALSNSEYASYPTYTQAGAICGLNIGTSIISNCYWNIDSIITKNNTNLANTDKKGADYDTDTTIPLTTDQMKHQSSFVDWDFGTVWNIDWTVNEGYPVLQVYLPQVNLPVITESGFVSGFDDYTAYWQYSFGDYNNKNCATIAICNLISYYKQTRGFSDLYEGTDVTKEIHDEIFEQLSDGPKISEIEAVTKSYVIGKGYKVTINSSYMVDFWMWGTIKAAIDDDLPVFYSNGDHIMFVTGYKVEDDIKYLYVNNSNLGEMYGWIEFNNPYYASSIIISN